MAEANIEGEYQNASLIYKVLRLDYDTDTTQSDLAWHPGNSTSKENCLLQQTRWIFTYPATNETETQSGMEQQVIYQGS